MKWWSRFLKSRRQSDRVKLLCVFSILGISFLCDFIYRGIQVYQIVTSPVEYVLTSPAGEIKDTQIETIRQIDDIKAVSRQQEISVILKCQNEEFTFPGLELSENYLETVYGIKDNSSMKTFYMNQAAWEQIAATQKEEKESKEMQMKYELQSGKDEEMETGVAKIVLLAESSSDEQPCVFCEGNSADLAVENDTIRVCVGQQDLTEGDSELFRQTGLEVTNATEIQQSVLLRKMQFLRMKYDFLIVILSCSLVLCLKKWENQVQDAS